jgi:hypothetical protein
MSPEEKELLNKSISLAEENNRMIHSMRRYMRIASIARSAYWVIIIGSLVGAFYFLQPYVDQIRDTLSGADEALENFKLSP